MKPKESKKVHDDNQNDSFYINISTNSFPYYLKEIIKLSNKSYEVALINIDKNIFNSLNCNEDIYIESEMIFNKFSNDHVILFLQNDEYKIEQPVYSQVILTEIDKIDLRFFGENKKEYFLENFSNFTFHFRLND